MKNLCELNALGNRLTELPTCMAVMPNLKMLDVTGNNIRDIPRLHGSYPSLRHLFIDGAKLTKECLTWLSDKAYYS